MKAPRASLGVAACLALSGAFATDSAGGQLAAQRAGPPANAAGARTNATAPSSGNVSNSAGGNGGNGGNAGPGGKGGNGGNGGNGGSCGPEGTTPGQPGAPGQPGSGPNGGAGGGGGAGASAGCVPVAGAQPLHDPGFRLTASSAGHYALLALERIRPHGRGSGLSCDHSAGASFSCRLDWATTTLSYRAAVKVWRGSHSRVLWRGWLRARR